MLVCEVAVSEGVWSSVCVIDSSSDVGEDGNGEDSGCVFGFEDGSITEDRKFERLSDGVVSDKYETSPVGMAWGTELAGIIAEVTTVDDCCCVEGDES